jgi:hypothetical protein
MKETVNSDDREYWVSYTINGSIEMIKAVQQFILNYKLEEAKREETRSRMIRRHLLEKWNNKK